MQTIDTIRKTNELSKVLKEHGLTEDTFDSLEQARSVTGDSSQVYATKEQDEVSGQFSQKITALERSKHMLSGRIDSLQKELASTQEHLKQALSRLDSAEARIRAAKTQPEQAPAQQQSKPQEQPQQSEPQQQAPQARSQQQSSQQSDDSVSIENMFYYGTR